MADDRHIFTITATVRGADSDYTSRLETVEVRAHSLRAALRAAADLPVSAWFPVEDPAT